MSGGVKIIKANLEDREVIVALLLRQFEEHAIETGAEQLLRAVGEMLHNGNFGFFLLARAGERAVGVADVAFTWTLEHGGKSAWLDELYVAPGIPWERCGHGALAGGPRSGPAIRLRCGGPGGG